MTARNKIILLVALFIVLIIISLFSVFSEEGSLLDIIPRLLSSSLVMLIAIKKILSGTPSKLPLFMYDSHFSKDVGNAFKGERNNRKKLISAYRLYNEKRFEQSLKTLQPLLNNCTTNDEYAAVGILLGVNYTAMNYIQNAVEIYQMLLDMNIENDVVYSNYAHILKNEFGDYEKAKEYNYKSMQLNPESAIAYNNLAMIFFEENNFDNAIEYAEKALDKNPKQYEASSLLAIINSINGNESIADKYFRMAVSSGQSKTKLKAAISMFTGDN